MNIIEAIKSGRRFKRKDDIIWYSDKNLWIHYSDVLAEDWEIEPEPEPEEKIELSWKQIKAALSRALFRQHNEIGERISQHLHSELDLNDLLKSELGF